MSKKHFNALAARLNSVRPTSPKDCDDNGHRIILAHALQQWVKMVLIMADFCAEQNPRFNRERFLTACGME